MLGNEKKCKTHNLLMLWTPEKIPYDMHLFINNTYALSTKLNFNKTQLAETSEILDVWPFGVMMKSHMQYI